MSREDPTRRLGELNDGVFGLLVQTVDERFDSAMVTSQSTEFPFTLLAFDSNAVLQDTILQLPGVHRSVAVPGSETRYMMTRERPFAMRPIWTSGDGWIAHGHGREPLMTIRRATDTIHVVWPEDTRALGDADWTAYHESRFEASARTQSAADRAGWEQMDIPWDELRAEVAEWQVDAQRPQFSGALGNGPCIALLGFRPTDGPLAESNTVVIVNLSESGQWAIVRIESDPGFVRELGPDALYYIGVSDMGTRVVERYPLPSGITCD